MSIHIKFQQLLGVLQANANALQAPATAADFTAIEQLLETPLPAEIRLLYSYANGQTQAETGLLFDHHFCSLADASEALDISRSFIRPAVNQLLYPQQSAELLAQLVEQFRQVGNQQKNWLGMRKKWHRLQVSCYINGYGGPYVYASANTPDSQREIMQLSDSVAENVMRITDSLYKLERANWYWNEIQLTIFADGQSAVNRSCYDFDQAIPFTSTPAGAIQKKYLHYKWLPVFSDYGGNYIGVDLDPDINGTIGQVINFGRDVEDMYVLAPNLEVLFERMMQDVQKTESILRTNGVYADELWKLT